MKLCLNIRSLSLRLTPGILEREGIRNSIGDKGRYMDNLFIERLWRTVKYEEFILSAYDNDCKVNIGLAQISATIIPSGLTKSLVTGFQ